MKKQFSQHRKPPTINMLSSADKVKGQGVGSAYLEQVKLTEETLGQRVHIVYNKLRYKLVTHYHSIDFKFYLHALFGQGKTIRIGYVHFLPETLKGSIKLPAPIEKLFYKYVLSFYHQMDLLVTVNPIFIDKLEALGFDRNKITYIPNYVSDQTFYPQTAETIQETRAKYGISCDDFVVLGVGQIQTRKGVPDFIDIARQCPELTFVWAGGFSFGKITDGYEALKKEVEHPPANLKFIGIVDRSEMNDIYNMSNLMFLPSYSELFPMTVLESMSVHTPLLLRDLELYEDILFDYYLKANTNQEFIRLIRQLKNDSAFYKHWQDQSANGSHFYSKQNVGQMWKTFYRSAIQSRRDYISLRRLKKLK